MGCRVVPAIALAATALIAADCAVAQDQPSYSQQALEANRSIFVLKNEAEQMKARADVAEAYSRMSKSGVFVDENGTIGSAPGGSASYVATFGVPEAPKPGMPTGVGSPATPGLPGGDALSAAPAVVDTTPKLQSITGDRAFFEVSGHGVIQAKVGQSLPGGYKVVALDNGATLERGGVRSVVNIDWALPDEDKPKADPLSRVPGLR